MAHFGELRKEDGFSAVMAAVETVCPVMEQGRSGTRPAPVPSPLERPAGLS